MGWRKGKLHFCCCFIKTKDLSTLTCCNLLHCEKIANIRSFPGPYFPAFGLNKETYSVSLRIQSLCGKIRTRKTPNMDTSHIVLLSSIFRLFPRRGPSLLKYWHKQTTLNIPRQDYDWRMYSSILDILVCLRFISLLGLLYFIRQNLLFQKHFCILRFLRSLTVDVFDEARTQNLFIRRWKTKFFGHKGLYGQNDYVSLFFFALLYLAQFPSHKKSSWWISSQ